MAACKAKGWTMITPDAPSEFMRYGEKFAEAMAAQGANGPLALLESLRRGGGGAAGAAVAPSRMYEGVGDLM